MRLSGSLSSSSFYYTSMVDDSMVWVDIERVVTPCFRLSSSSCYCFYYCLAVEARLSTAFCNCARISWSLNCYCRSICIYFSSICSRELIISFCACCKSACNYRISWPLSTLFDAGDYLFGNCLSLLTGVNCCAGVLCSNYCYECPLSLPLTILVWWAESSPAIV